VNQTYALCPTYAKILVVPGPITDDILTQAAQFRTSSRVPVLSWKHPRCSAGIARSSQPRTGVIGYRSSQDELVLSTIRKTSATTGQAGPSMLIADCRPFVNAYANTVAGGGYEAARVYDGCRLVPTPRALWRAANPNPNDAVWNS